VTPEQWMQALEVLTDAAEKPADQQEQLVRKAFPNDAALQREVLTLLGDLHSVSMRLPDAALACVGDSPSPVDISEATTELTAAPVLAPGEMCGRYRAIKHLGSGGMGTVYLAEDTLLNVEVALKIPAAKWIETPAGRMRLKREAQRAAALRGHPHLATVLDVIEVDLHGRSCPVLVMEYVEGRPANDVLRLGPVRPQRALAWAIQITDALEYAHDRAILHCDLKPGNVVITPDDKVKVLDFGLARAQYERFDATEPLIGTLSYMAPEQLLEARFSESSDTYALGVTLFELLARRPPFTAPVREDLLAEILAAPPPNVSELAPAVPKAFDQVLQRALAKQPHERYQSAREFREDLLTLGRHIGMRTPRSLTANVVRWVGWGTAVVALVLVVLSFLGYVSSTMIDVALGRTGEFVAEEQRSPLYWGYKSIFAPAVLVIAFILVARVSFIVCRLAYTAIPPLRRRCAPWFAACASRIKELPRGRMDSVSQAVLLLQVAALAAFYVKFEPMIDAMKTLWDPRVGGDLYQLSPSNEAVTSPYREIATMLLFLSCVAWTAIIVARRRNRQRLVTFELTAGILGIALNMFLLALPYQLLYKNDSERVNYRSNTCYIVARGPDRQRLFCPLNDGDWLITLPLNDPEVQRTGRRENIFTPLNRQTRERAP